MYIQPTSGHNDRIHSRSELSNQSDTVQSMAQQSHSGSFVNLKDVDFLEEMIMMMMMMMMINIIP